MLARALIVALVPLTLAACGSSGSNCTANGQKTADGGGCCSETSYAGRCAPAGCYGAEQVSYGLSGTSTDPTGANCCALNGATVALSSTNAQTPYCNPAPDCIAGGTAPTNGDQAYCCSGLTYSGVCTPAPVLATDQPPVECVLSYRVTTSAGTNCCAAAGDFDAGAFAAIDGGPVDAGVLLLCNPRTDCTTSGNKPTYANGSDCCSGELDSTGACCSLTGEPGNGGHCCAAGVGVDTNTNCEAPTTCTAGGEPSVTPNGSDCCKGFASDTTGICASTPQ